MSELEEGLLFQIKIAGLPEPEREYRFGRTILGESPHPPAEPGIRKRLAEASLKDWRFDFAWPSAKIAVECEGGIFVGGRHNRGVGFQDDIVKYNAATEHGWRVFRYTSEHIDSGYALNQIERVLDG